MSKVIRDVKFKLFSVSAGISLSLFEKLTKFGFSVRSSVDPVSFVSFSIFCKSKVDLIVLFGM